MGNQHTGAAEWLTFLSASRTTGTGSTTDSQRPRRFVGYDMEGRNSPVSKYNQAGSFGAGHWELCIAFWDIQQSVTPKLFLYKLY